MSYHGIRQRAALPSRMLRFREITALNAQNSEMPTNYDKLPGSAAIANYLNKHLSTRADAVFSPEFGFTNGNSSALDAVEVYKCNSNEPHWLYITYGFSDLSEKESEDPNLSGYGFELTFRLRTQKESVPPAWPCDHLNELALEVFQSGNPLKPGAIRRVESSLKPGSTTGIHGFLIVEDPELATIKTHNGNLTFLLIFGLTHDEAELSNRGSQAQLASIAQKQIGRLLVTDLNRQSLVENPETRELLIAKANKDNESDGTLDCPQAEWFFMTRAIVLLPIDIVPTFTNQLNKRLGHGLNLTIKGSDCEIIFCSASTESFFIEETKLVIELPASTAKNLADRMQPVSSTHNFENIPVSIEFA